MSRTSRRRFLGTATAGGSLLLGSRGWTSPRPRSRPLGAASELRLAVVGLRSRGMALAGVFQRTPGARVVAFCDPDGRVLGERAAEFERRHGVAPKTFRDLRRLLEDPEVDALAVATPNHWHALATVWGCQAGKDVYCEKPVSHNVWEGRQAVAAAERYGRVVAAGTQSRSSEPVQRAIEMVRRGELGPLRVARGLCYKSRPSIGRVRGAQAVPGHIDYDLWCGPAPLEPLRRRNLHYDWHWVWPTGNGDIGNQGIHQMDLARQALGAGELAPETVSVGGRFGYRDDGETPNTQMAVFRYPQGLLIFEVRGLYENNGEVEKEGYRGVKIGNVLECEDGYAVLGVNDARILDRNGRLVHEFRGADHMARHVKNFVDACLARRPESLAAPILEGHLSSALCHFANISHRTGRISPPEEIRAAFRDRPFAAETLERFEEHLLERGLRPGELEIVLGRPLRLVPGREEFDDPLPNLLLSRLYRPPFVVPALA